MEPENQPKGLISLLQSTTAKAETGVSDVSSGSTVIPIDSIVQSHTQPRKDFDQATLAELADSIKSKGIIQPIVVRPAQQAGQETIAYEIIAGERRWRAAKLAGMTQVPVVIKKVHDDTDMLVLSLIENIQRADLNPIEEAEALRHLNRDLNLSQEQIADAIGKSRAAVANTIRLLELPDAVRDAVRLGKLSVGHAKVLLGLPGQQLQSQFAAKCQAEGLSVRQLEALIGAGQPTATGTISSERKGALANPSTHPPHVQELEQKLSRHLGTRVVIEEGKRRGRIIIEFYSVADFDRVTKLMGMT